MGDIKDFIQIMEVSEALLLQGLIKMVTILLPDKMLNDFIQCEDFWQYEKPKKYYVQGSGNPKSFCQILLEL